MARRMRARRARPQAMAEPPHALIVAGPTASGKSALALALAERLGGTRHQRRLHAGLSRAAHPDRAADAGGGGAWCRTALRRAAGGRAGQRRLVARARRWRRWRRRARPGGCRSCAAAPGCISPALTEGLAEIPEPGDGGAGRGAARCWPSIGPAGAARRAGQGRSGHRRAAAPDRQPAHRPRLGGLARHRARPRGLAGGARARRRRGASPRSCSTRRARRCARPSPPASPPCWRQGALEEVRGAAGARPRSGAAGDARARRAGTGRASARRDHARRGGARGRSWSTGQYTKRQATWFRHHAAGRLRAHAYDPCANRGSGAIFGKRTGRFDRILFATRVDALQRAPATGAPP